MLDIKMKSQPQDIIEKLASTDSRLEKESILESALEEGCEDFFEGLKLCLDKLVTFGVKQVPFKKGSEQDQGLPWGAFLDLADKLQSRQLTGHAARDAINLAMDVATESQWNGFYRRILIKDLRAGVSDKTVNKVCKKLKRPDLQVPVFGCQLAHDGAKHQNKIHGKKLIEGKLDGSRLLIFVNENGIVECFSRNGKVVTNFSKIQQQFEELTKLIPESLPLVFDGEIMSSSFQDLMKQMYRVTDVNTDDAIYHVFDCLPGKDFINGICEIPQIERSKHLSDLLSKHIDNGLLSNIHIVGYEEVDLDLNEGVKRFDDINREAIEQGLEGIMIKDPNAQYVCKRSHSWLKIKPVISVDLKVVDFEEGTGRNAGRLGAMVCHGYDNDRWITVNAGSGFSDEQRDRFWEDRDRLMGLTVEILSDGISQNSDGSYSLRFPRFKTFRGTYPGEKM